MNIKIREARPEDILQIQVIRNSVKENTLSDRGLVTDKDCEEFLFERGKGWVSEVDGRIVGFSILDLKDNNIWALFVHPDFENKGVGRKLHEICSIGIFSKGKKVYGLEPHREPGQRHSIESRDGRKPEFMEKGRSSLK